MRRRQIEEVESGKLEMVLKICFFIILIYFLSVSGCVTVKTSFRQEELSSAQQAYHDGNYEKVVVLLEAYLAHGRLSKGSEDAQFLLGESYYNLKDYQQSARVFQGYLDNFPDGDKIKDAKGYLEKINQILAIDRESVEEKEMTSSSGNAEQITEETVDVVIEKDHSYTLSPTYPGDSGVESYLVVTGIAFNKGSKPALDLRIQVTLYSFFEKILDVDYAYIGHLTPGEKRPFSVKIPHFKNVTIDRYEIKPLWSDK